MKNTAYWGKNTQSALQLCRLVASTATMESDSAFFSSFLSPFLFWQPDAKSDPKWLPSPLLSVQTRRSPQRDGAAQENRSMEAASGSNTSLRDWSARLEHKSTLIVLAEDDILAAPDDECYSFLFFTTGRSYLGWWSWFIGKQKVLLILKMISRSERIFAFQSWEQEDEMKPDDYHGGEDVLSVCCATGPPAASASCVFWEGHIVLR